MESFRLMDFWYDLDFILLHACLDGRRGEFVGFELYECNGVGWISSQSIIFLFTYINYVVMFYFVVIIPAACG